MSLPLPDIDETDNLDVAQYIDLAMHGIDSSDDDSGSSSDDDEYDLNSEHGNESVCEDSGDIENATLNVGSHSGKGSHSPSRRRRRKRGRRSRSRRSEEHNPVVFVADTVLEVGGVMLGATSSVVGATTGLFTAAVAHTPIISKTVKAFVHR